MKTKKLTPLDAKMAFAFSEFTKPYESDELIMRSKSRLKLYDSCTWELATVGYEDLFIDWKMGVGYRKWARGSLPKVIEAFKKHPDDPLWSRQNGGLLLGKIIVIQRGGRLCIDDGCHRAIARCLAGYTDLDVMIGTPKKQ